LQVAGESDRLETLWQRQRKQAKREYMRLVAKYEADLKEAEEYGLDEHHHPEAPEEPDFDELEEQHQLTRHNLERLSAFRISCMSLIENLLQYMRLCSMVIPSRAIETSKRVVANSDLFSVIASPSKNPIVGLATDDFDAQLEVLTSIDDDDELKLLYLQLTLWMESALSDS